MNDNSKRYYLTLLIITIIAIFWAGKIEINVFENGNMDLYKYRDMALASPALNFNIPHPYVYRIFAPWLAGIIPLSINLSFYILNFIFLLALSFAFYKFIVFHKTDEKIALLVTLAFVFNRYFFQFLAYDYFQLSDTLSYFLLLVSFLLLANKQWHLFGLVLIIGVLTREIALIIIPVGYVYLFEKKFNKNDYLYLSDYSVIAILVFILVRLLIPQGNGGTYFTQFNYGISHFFEIPALSKRFLIPLTPFLVIPFIFFKDLVDFFKDKIYLLVYFLLVIISTLFGNDYERLMAPAAPVFFLFLAVIIKKYLCEKDSGSLRKISMGLIILSIIVSSFYHLWGIFKLPNREVTMQVTLLTDFIIFALFMVLKYKDRIKPINTGR